MDLETLQSLEGRSLPPGSYRIERDAHATMVAAVHAAAFDFDIAHPVYAHLAPHCGMGWKLDEFFELVGFPMDGGALFGEGDLTYHRPMLIDVDYEVRGHVVSVERKQGTRTGTFDLITLHLELVDEQERVVVTSRETYVFPRAGVAAS